MCGIIGIVGNELVCHNIFTGLQRLEYRGYDSAGIAVINAGKFERVRAVGKLGNLHKQLQSTPIDSSIGIGHTRWATHGIANEENAHPHISKRVALVHNGIIENYLELKSSLPAKYIKQFQSQTDSEVLVFLITQQLDNGLEPIEAMKAVIPRLHGAFAFIVMFLGHDNLLFGMRQGSPLAVGVGDNAHYFGSDAISMAHLTNKIAYLDEGDSVVLTQKSCQFFNKSFQTVNRPFVQSNASSILMGKGNYQHYMQKEIYEQPTVVGATLHAIINQDEQKIHLDDGDHPIFNNKRRIQFSACGTAFYAGLVAKYWSEYFMKINMDCDVASEFRYRMPPLEKDILGLVVSQSGETMDSLEAVKYMQAQNIGVLAVVNVAMSSMARLANHHYLTKAGPEIGVASTKAFTTQIAMLAGLLLHLAEKYNTADKKLIRQWTEYLNQSPSLMAETLLNESSAHNIAQILSGHQHVLYLGRGISYPIALEGALKLKEISYIHAEAYAAGEMKHGPIALIEKNSPVVAIIPDDDWFEKTASNLQEATSRGAQIIAITTQNGLQKLQQRINISASYVVPNHQPFITPLINAIPVQLIAYHTAVLKGTDVDQPRNLAKSVTVE